MMRLSKTWAVARMELRHTRRLVRYWVFIGIAYLFGLAAYVYYSALHALFSAASASVGMIGPRYLMMAIGLYYVTGFVLGIVFLGFDVRARDVRESIVEVLDSRPMTNFELVAGRFLALFLAGWIPMAFLALLIEGLGALLPLLGSPIGRTVEPFSLVSFVFLMGMPAISFAVGLVFAITLLVRNRIVAAVVCVAAIVGLYAALFTIPYTYGIFIDYLGSRAVAFPSDIVPGLALNGSGWLQRLAFVAIALGLLGLATVLHPRLDGGGRKRPAMISTALLVVGALFLTVASLRVFREAGRIEQWRGAHAARAGEPVPDIVAIDGSVVVDLGERIDADLSIVVQAPPGQTLNDVLLTLNPGVRVAEVTDEDGRPLAAEHADGLLDIGLERPLAPGRRLTLNLRYGGPPDTNFAYLDSVINLLTLDANEAQIGILGFEPAIFDSRFVALMPGIHWLPASGVAVGRDDPRTRPRDFFRIALDVDVPADWLVAGPGRRETVSRDDERATFRFAPEPSVPEVALVAAGFESFATEIDGVTFEVLVHPDHDANFEVLADAREEVEQWIADRLDVARQAGLAYPFDAFTVVEVPNTLRSYEGGWRLDTALAPPAMMLLKETSFPTARFDVDYVNIVGNGRDYDQDGGKARIDRDRLVRFFSNDFAGGNIFTGAARSFFAHRSSAYGPNAIPLEFALEELATLLVSGQRSYFSVHLFRNINASATSVVAGMQGAGVTSIADALITVQTNRTEVWEAALDSRLADIDPYEDPQRTIDVLSLKGGQMAEAIYDSLGAEAVGELLAYLLERHAGASYTLDDLVAAGDATVGGGLGQLFDDWFSGTGLPGFTSNGAEIFRLPDSDSGDSRYQLIVRVENGEPVVGFARVAWVAGSGASNAALRAAVGDDLGDTAVIARGARATSDPIRIPGRSAIEFGVVLSEPPLAAYVHPYLSLNRADFLVDQFNTATIRTRDLEPFNGVREAPLVTARDDDRIIADDLDEGFTIESDEGGDRRLAGRETAIAGMDRGLPVATGNAVPTRWSRRNVQSAWGRYRHTLAYMGPGDGSTRAVMPVSLPAPGTWELEVHMPFLQYVSPDSRGTWHLTIVSEYGREPVDFDATIAAVGWNLVGEYDLPAGDVRVEVSDMTDGLLIVADAVAWSPVRVRGLPGGRSDTAAAAEAAASAEANEPQ